MALVAERADTGDAAWSEKARKAMIDSQLRVSGVNDEAVLAAMSAVKREDFVPTASRGVAYIDRAIALDDGGFLPAPLVQGLMLSEAAPTRDDIVLVVDGGSGYLAALAKQMAGAVKSIAARGATAQGSAHGDVTLLLIDGAIKNLPDALTSCLAEGARVVTGVVERGVTRLASGRKIGGRVALLPLAEIGMPILPQFAAPKSWSF